MGRTEVVDEWTQRLTGLSRERLAESREWIESLGVDHLRLELTRPDIDAAAGSCMLKSAIEQLESRGVESTKLVSKLRRDPAVWPAVTELISVNAIAKLSAPGATVELDGGSLKPGSPRPDLRLKFPALGQSFSVEFKAIGLSAEETALFKKAAAVLPSMVPSFGVADLHIAAQTDQALYAPTREERRKQELENRRNQKRQPAHIRHLNAAAVAAHYTEQRYLERARDRIVDSLRQLPDAEPGWVALWWSNGAPASAIQQLLSTVDLPANILGIFLVGAAVVAPDPEIHYFQFIIPRDDEVREALPDVVSDVGHPFADKILDQVERSTGVRPTLIVQPRGPRPKRQRLLFRDGARPIFPFNLLLMPDPPGVREAVAFEGSAAEEERMASEILRGAKRVH